MTCHLQLRELVDDGLGHEVGPASQVLPRLHPHPLRRRSPGLRRISDAGNS